MNSVELSGTRIPYETKQQLKIHRNLTPLWSELSLLNRHCIPEFHILKTFIREISDWGFPIVLVCTFLIMTNMMSDLVILLPICRKIVNEVWRRAGGCTGITLPFCFWTFRIPVRMGKGSQPINFGMQSSRSVWYLRQNCIWESVHSVFAT